MEPLTCQSDLQLPFQNGEMLQVQQPLERYIWLLVLKSGVPEHALDALRINFEPQVLVEIYNFVIRKQCNVVDVSLEQSTNYFLHERFTKTLTLV